MALQDITQVSISLETSAVSTAGFGTPLFASRHRWFTERVRAYTSLTALAADIPTTSNEYKAAQKAFSQIPAPSVVKVGRRDTTVSTLALQGDPSVAGTKYGLTVTSPAAGAVSITVTTDGVTDTDAEVVTALIAGLAAVTDVTIGGTTSLTLTKVAVDFTISDVVGMTISHAATETAADMMTAISAVDDDFYFVSSDDKSASFVTAMAADIEAKTKLYFVSTDDVESIAALTDPVDANDILGLLQESNYYRTVGLFHQDAATEFPEMAFVGIGAPKEPGTLTWANQKVAGIGASEDPATSLNLSYTQKNNLSTRNANFITPVGGIDIFREGKTMGGERIDIMRSRDLLVARITEAFQNKLINSDKVTYDDNGINEMRNVLESTLSRYVSTETAPNILQANNPFTTTFPKSKDVPFATKASRVLNASFVAYLAGAIEVMVITGTLTLDAA